MSRETLIGLGADDKSTLNVALLVHTVFWAIAPDVAGLMSPSLWDPLNPILAWILLLYHDDALAILKCAFKVKVTVEPLIE